MKLRCALPVVLLLAAAVAPPAAAQSATTSVLRLRSGSLTVGNDDVCGIRDDSSVICWGFDRSGQADPPPGRFIAVSAGGSGSERTCGLRPDRSAVCWGANSGLTPPGRFLQISTGGFVPGGFVPGRGEGTGGGVLVAGKAECWTIQRRAGVATQSVNLRPGYYSSVSAAAGFACGVQRNGYPSCWGRTLVDISPPHVRVTQVAVWGFASARKRGWDPPVACALTVSGSARCWGSSRWQQTAPPARAGLKQLSVGQHVVCALTVSGPPLCWGSDIPLQPGSDARQVEVGNFALCQLGLDQTVVCTGDDTQMETHAPGAPFKSVSVGNYTYGCGIRADAHPECWGDGSPEDSPDLLMRSFSSDSEGNGGCGIRLDWTLWCGLGEDTQPPTGKYSSVAVNANGFCAIARSTEHLKCWEGFAAPPPRGRFTQVSVALGSTGYDFGCALAASSGTVRCWGDGTGLDGFRTGQTSPPAGAFRQVSVASGGACALPSSGRPRCWGEPGFVPPGRFRQIELGVFPPSEHRWRLCGITLKRTLLCGFLGRVERLGGPYRSFSVGNSGVCAVDNSGGIRCWDGAYGRIPSLAER